MLWSARIESVRKGIECTFGILKIRFRILWSKIQFQKQIYVDNCSMCCCILHNMNLHDDNRHIVNIVFENDDDDDDIRDGIELMRIRGRIDADRVAMLDVEARVGIIQREGEHYHRIPVPHDYLDENHYTFRKLLVTHYTYCKQHHLVKWF